MLDATFEYAAITPLVREAVFAVWDNTCAYCQENAAEHVDHIWPRALGGEDALENYAAACAPCNLRKSATPFPEGYTHIMRGKATKKAAKVRAYMISRDRSASIAEKREQQRNALLDELTILTADKPDYSVAEFSLCTPTEIKKEVANVKRAIREKLKAEKNAIIQKRRSIETTKLANVIEGLGRCPTFSKLFVERHYPRSSLSTLSKKAAHFDNTMYAKMAYDTVEVVGSHSLMKSFCDIVSDYHVTDEICETTGPRLLINIRSEDERATDIITQVYQTYLTIRSAQVISNQTISSDYRCKNGKISVLGPTLDLFDFCLRHNCQKIRVKNPFGQRLLRPKRFWSPA